MSKVSSFLPFSVVVNFMLKLTNIIVNGFIRTARNCNLGNSPHISVQNDNQTNNCVADEVCADENGEHCGYSNLG